MTSNNAPINPGPWTTLETLCLIVCKELLLSSHIAASTSNLSALYKFVADSPNVKTISLNIGMKSSAQIAAKVANLSKMKSQP